MEYRVNYLLTEVVQSNKYYKSRAVGVTSEVGLTTSEILQNNRAQETRRLLYLRDTRSHAVHYTISPHQKRKKINIIVFWDLFP